MKDKYYKQSTVEALPIACLTPQIERNAGYEVIKRTFDIIFSLFALIITSPLLLLFSICIHAEDGGPVFFKQTRLTKDGKQFTMYKLRSMVVDAEKQLEDYLSQNELNGPAFKLKCDPRVTKVGQLIRKTSIDELPQFFNVLRGDMSIIGPRPPLPREVAQYTPYQLHRLDIKAGIACIHEASGRSDEKDFSVWVEQDLEYIRTRSVKSDLTILIKIVKVVLHGYGAA